MNKSEAQRRADRIRAFREEILQLESEGTLSLQPDQRDRLQRHHDEILADLALRFDVDTTEALKQMSWGMGIASLLGAIALSAAVFFLFHRIWGLLPTSAQVAALLLGPLAGLAATEIAARKEKTFYFASLLALVTVAAFVLNLQVLGGTFNITPGHNAFLAWAVFAALLAYAYELMVLLVVGIGFLVPFLAATAASWSGATWVDFGGRPENFLPAGAVLLVVGLAAPHRRCERFPAAYRLSAALAFFVPFLILAQWGETSYLPFEPRSVEALYQITGFVLGGLAIWAGIRRQWPEVTYPASAFLVILLLIKAFDWWWDWMPRYLFFLILGLMAIGVLLLLGRLRGLMHRGAS